MGLAVGGRVGRRLGEGRGRGLVQRSTAKRRRNVEGQRARAANRRVQVDDAVGRHGAGHVIVVIAQARALVVVHNAVVGVVCHGQEVLATSGP